MNQNQFKIEGKTLSNYPHKIGIPCTSTAEIERLFKRLHLFSTLKANKKLAKKGHNSVLFFIDSARPSTGRVQKTCVPSPQAFNGHISNKNKQLEAKAKIT